MINEMKLLSKDHLINWNMENHPGLTVQPQRHMALTLAN